MKGRLAEVDGTMEWLVMYRKICNTCPPGWHICVMLAHACMWNLVFMCFFFSFFLVSCVRKI